jgi:hypothetical protein
VLDRHAPLVEALFAPDAPDVIRIEISAARFARPRRTL